jgi:hypothetical protein
MDFDVSAAGEEIKSLKSSNECVRLFCKGPVDDGVVNEEKKGSIDG